MTTLLFFLLFAALFYLLAGKLRLQVHVLFCKIADNAIFSAAVVGILSIALSMLLSLCIRMPQPNINDEFGYLLTADTFVHGRLTNPPHPFPLSFETFHVLMRPTYQSKYPVGQSAAIALGILLTGLPIAGVWLSTAAACSAVTWALRCWITPRWALFGGLLLAVHPMITKWSQSYWGGSVAMLGGALLFGALPRIVNSRGTKYAVIFGLGIALLANSRPYEGAIAALFATGTLMVLLRKEGSSWSDSGRVFGYGGAVVCLNFGWMALYNDKVTGSPITLPFSVYERTHDTVPTFVFQSLKTIPGYLNAPERDMDVEHSRVFYDSQQTLSDFLDVAAWKMTTMFDVCFKVADLHTYTVDYRAPVPWVAKVIAYLPACALLGLPAACRKYRWVRVAAFGIVVGFTSLVIETWLLPHYVAPEAVLIAIIWVASAREVYGWAQDGIKFGRPIVFGITSLFIAGFCFSWSELSSPAWAGWAPARIAVQTQLNKSGPCLVLVEYSTAHNSMAVHNPGQEWVHNSADIDAQHIIWARFLDSSTNGQIMDYYPHRTVWLLEPDNSPPKLTLIRPADSS